MRIFLIRHLMNENSICRCLICFPFNQIYTAKAVVTTDKVCETASKDLCLFHDYFESTFFGHWAL